MEKREIFLDPHLPSCSSMNKQPSNNSDSNIREEPNFMLPRRIPKHKKTKKSNGDTCRSCFRGSKEWMIHKSILYNNAIKKYHERGHLAVCNNNIKINNNMNM
mmetsp:Transcript_28884/g.78225  ORF Transcript_28884/g.78225 Transcript_28884/m.78225 type:complete len:103 (+) Transcript_28884:1686-1994(+)